MDVLLNKIKSLFTREKSYNDVVQNITEENKDNSQKVDRRCNHQCREGEKKISIKHKSENRTRKLDQKIASKKLPRSEHCNRWSKEQLIEHESPIENKTDDKKVEDIVEEVLGKFSRQIENMCNKKIELFLQSFKQQLKKKKGERELAKSSNKVKEEIIIEILKRLENETSPSLSVIKKKRKSNFLNEHQRPNRESHQIISISEIYQQIPEKEKSATPFNNNVNRFSKKHHHSSRKSTKSHLKDFSCQMINETNTLKRVQIANSGKIFGFPASYVSENENLIPFTKKHKSQTNCNKHLLQAIEETARVYEKHKQKPESLLHVKLEKYPLPGPSKTTLNHRKKYIVLPTEYLNNPKKEFDCDTSILTASESNHTQSRSKCHKLIDEFSKSTKHIEEEPELEEIFFRSIKNQERSKFLASKDFYRMRNLKEASSTSLQIDRKKLTTVQNPIYSYCQIMADRNLRNCMDSDIKSINFSRPPTRDTDGNDDCFEDKKIRLNKNNADTHLRKDVINISKSEMCHSKYKKNTMFIKPVLSKDTIPSKINKKSKFREFLDEQNIDKASEHCQTEFEQNNEKSKSLAYNQDKICKLLTAIQERLHSAKITVKTTETSISSTFLRTLNANENNKSFPAAYKTYDDFEEKSVRKLKKPERVIIGSRTPVITGVISDIKRYRDKSVGGGTIKISPRNRFQKPIQQFKSSQVAPIPETAPQKSEIKRFKSSYKKKASGICFEEKIKTKVSNHLVEKVKNVPQTRYFATKSRQETPTKNNFINAELSTYEKRKEYDRQMRGKIIQKTNTLLETDVDYVYVQNEKNNFNFFDLDNRELENLSRKFGAIPSNAGDIKSALDEIENCVNSCLNRLNSNFVISTPTTDNET